MKTNSTPLLILASKSPRRKQLLEEAGYQFSVKTFEYPETYDKDLPVREIAEYLAIRKNQAHRNKSGNEVVITADTIVVAEDRVLEKPTDDQEAFDMLFTLSGKTHEVITGVCISSHEHQISFSEVTTVTFRPLDKQEIHHYVKTFKPMDKAGAYGIQEWIGLIGIPRIEGSYFNVVGLPIDKLYSTLKFDFGISPR